MDLEIFKELGLNEREIKVYVCLIKEGELTATKIANFTKINRTTVYLELDNLIEKGLANFIIKDSKKYFNATPPEKLLDILEERKRKLKNVVTELNNLKKSPEKVGVRYFEGKEGVKNLYLDVMKEDKDVFVFGGTGIGFKTFKYYYPQIYRQYENKKFRGKMIVNSGTEKDFEIYKKFNVEVRHVPKGYDSKVTTIVYGDKVALQSLQEDNIYFLLIEDKNLAMSYRNTFNFMWESLKKKSNKTKPF